MKKVAMAGRPRTKPQPPKKKKKDSTKKKHKKSLPIGGPPKTKRA